MKIEASVPVCFFLRGRGEPRMASDSAIREAFSAAAGPRGKKRVCADVKMLLPTSLRRKIKCSAKWLYCDSGNITHAGAMYEVTISGTSEVLNDAARRLERSGYEAK